MSKFYFKSTKKTYEIDASSMMYKQFIMREIYRLNRTTIYLYPDKINTLVSMKHKKEGKDKVQVSLTYLGFGKWVRPETQMVSIQQHSEPLDHENGEDITGDMTDQDIDNVLEAQEQGASQDKAQDPGVDLLALYKKLASEGRNKQEIMKTLEISGNSYKKLQSQATKE